MTAPSLYLHFRALGRPFLWAAYFSPQKACAKTVGPSPSKCSLKAQAKGSFGQHASKRGLAHFQRITPHVVAVQLDQVEGV